MNIEYNLGTIADLRELFKRFKSQINGFALVEAQFESIISFKKISANVQLEALFDILDNDHDGRIDGLELLGGLALCCHGSLEEKARFCYEVFDFDLNSTMKRTELIMMMMSSVCGVILLTGGGEEQEPPIEVFEKLADDCLLRFDHNADGKISYEEFLVWVRSNRDLMSGIELFNRIALEAKNEVNPEDSAPETDDDFLSDTDKVTHNHHLKCDENRKITKSLISTDNNIGFPIRINDISSSSSAPWKGQIFEPTNYKKKKGNSDGPDTNLQLSWVFGYKSLQSRNNVKYLKSIDPSVRYIAYYTAALGIVYNKKTSTQSFYMGHVNEITCISIHPNNQIAATADVKSDIHIWTLDKMESGTITALSVINGIVKGGIIHLAFSPSGDRIASIGGDKDHTVTIYDVNNGEVISSTKGLRNVNDIAFSPDGSELVMVGKNTVMFCVGVNTKKRAISTCLGKIGSIGKRQTFFSVAYMKEYCIVGCASGEIYRFKDRVCITVVQAHGVREPVLTMFYNAKDGTLLTAGKDGLIKTWDSELKSVGEAIDISEDVNGDGKSDCGSLDCTIISLQQWSITSTNNSEKDQPLVISTRGSDIFEVTIPKSPGRPHSMNRIAWGHSNGELWGLAANPLKDEFVTCGDDKTIRVWSIRTHEQINLRKMPAAARSVAFSPTGELICLGMIDGSMALMESNSPSLRVYSTWKHTESIITDIKFSPDAVYIAAGSGDSNIYLYKSDDKKNYHRQAVCRGHYDSISHIDFSANSKFIQSNGEDNMLLFWDTEGNQIKNASTLRDLNWGSLTCPLNWAMQGIWSIDSNYADIHSCMALSDIGDIITGDAYNCLKLFKYPSLKPGSLHQRYVGHSSRISCVRFSGNKRYAISIGGIDRSILLWKHDIERNDESDSEYLDDSNAAEISSGASSSANEDGGKLINGVDVKLEVADVGIRSIEQEAANLGWSVDELKQYAYKHNDKLYLEALKQPEEQYLTSVLPWKSMIVEPTQWKSEEGTTDIDLELEWVHGHRSHDCRNNVIYSTSG